MDEDRLPEDGVHRQAHLLRTRLDEARAALSGLTRRVQRAEVASGLGPGEALAPSPKGSGGGGRRAFAAKASDLAATFREIGLHAAEFDEFVAQAADLEIRLRDSELRIDRARAESRDLSAQVAGLGEALQAAQRRGGEEAAKAHRLEAQVAETEAKFKEAQGRGDEEAAKARGLEARAADLEAQSAELEEKLRQAEQCVEAEVAGSRQLAAQAAELEARVVRSQAESAEWEARFLQAQRRVEAEVAGSRQLAAKAADLEEGLERSQACRATEAIELEKAALKASALAAQLADKEAKLLEVQRLAETEAAQLADNQARLRQAEQRAEAEAAQLADKEAKLLEVQRLAETEAAQLADSQAKLRPVEQRAEEEAVQLADSQTKLLEVQQRAEAEAARSRQLAAKVAELENQLASASAAPPPMTAPVEPLTQEIPGIAEAPIPALEPALEPGWAKALAYLRQSLASAYAHLRKLSATPLLAEQRARLKATASAIAQGTDALTMMGELWDEAGPAPAPGRLDTAVAAAVAVWEPVLRQRAVSVMRRQDAQLPAALFHPEGLRLALYQVLRNAYESMPRGGSLTLRFFKDDATGGACVSISDTGTGFSREALARLPEPFVSTKPGHLGLGLALTRRILDRWSASLEAGNNERIGATVTLRFALGREEPPPMQGDPLP
jgi:signal transduction histidine kinase